MKVGRLLPEVREQNTQAFSILLDVSRILLTWPAYHSTRPKLLLIIQPTHGQKLTVLDAGPSHDRSSAKPPNSRLWQRLTILARFAKTCCSVQLLSCCYRSNTTPYPAEGCDVGKQKPSLAPPRWLGINIVKTLCVSWKRKGDRLCEQATAL